MPRDVIDARALFKVMAATAAGAWTTTSIAASAQPPALPPPPIEERAQAVECLTLAIAYEAGFEPPEGQAAVAEVILNRLRDPAFPKTVCDVVFAGSTRKIGCQFTFTCDGSMQRKLPDVVISRARSVAEQAMDGQLPALIGDATNYHADYVTPYWAPTLVRVAKIGLHIFYRRPNATANDARADLSFSPPPSGPSSQKAPQTFAPWGLSPVAPSPIVP